MLPEGFLSTGLSSCNSAAFSLATLRWPLRASACGPQPLFTVRGRSAAPEPKAGSRLISHPISFDQVGSRPKMPLITAKQAPPRSFIMWGIGARGDEIRNPARIFSNSWQGPGAHFIGFRTHTKPQIAEPSVDAVQGGVVAVVLLGVALRRGMPILLAEDVIPKHPNVAQCQRHTGAKTRIASGRRIADQHDAFAIWEIDPVIGSVKRSQRPDRLSILEPFRRCTCRN